MRSRLRRRRKASSLASADLASFSGATGVAGQQFLAALAAHPFFEVTCLAASARTACDTPCALNTSVAPGGTSARSSMKIAPLALRSLTT